MIFHENRLLADDSHIISYLIFVEIGKNVAKFVVCCSHDWRFKGLDETVHLLSLTRAFTSLTYRVGSSKALRPKFRTLAHLKNDFSMQKQYQDLRNWRTCIPGFKKQC